MCLKAIAKISNRYYMYVNNEVPNDNQGHTRYPLSDGYCRECITTVHHVDRH